MIVVSDTTPLISLMKIGKLNLIEQLFGEVQIPDAVYIELISNPKFEEEAQQIKRSSFIKRVILEDSKAVNLLSRATGLDRGESEAIILSDTCKSDLLLMDENLSYEDIINCIEILRANGRHISDKLFRQLLEVIR